MNIERHITTDLDRDTGGEGSLETHQIRLENFLRDQSQALNAELIGYQTEGEESTADDSSNWPRLMTVDTDFRIVPPMNMMNPAHVKYVGDLDMKNAQRDKEHRHLRNEKFTKPRGTVFEELMTAVLHKRLKGRYIVVRTSKYDDFHNHVDHLIVDKETGEVVCVIDDVSQQAEGDHRIVNDKIKHALGTNVGIIKMATGGTVTTESGASVDYGIRLENRLDEAGLPVISVSCGKVDHIPVLLTTVSEKLFNNCLVDFDEDVNGFSESENLVFQEFVSKSLVQIGAIRSFAKSSRRELPADMKRRLDQFEKFLKTQTTHQ